MAESKTSDVRALSAPADHGEWLRRVQTKYAERDPEATERARQNAERISRARVAHTKASKAMTDVRGPHTILSRRFISIVFVCA